MEKNKPIRRNYPKPFMMRMTDEEFNMLKDRASARGIFSMSAYVRFLIHNDVNKANAD